jgi:hypothetical protein
MRMLSTLPFHEHCGRRPQVRSDDGEFDENNVAAKPKFALRSTPDFSILIYLPSSKFILIYMPCHNQKDVIGCSVFVRNNCTARFTLHPEISQDPSETGCLKHLKTGAESDDTHFSRTPFQISDPMSVINTECGEGVGRWGGVIFLAFDSSKFL